LSRLNTRMLGNDVYFGHDDQSLGIHPQADHPIGEAGRHTVAIVLEGNQAGRRDPLAVLDKAIEG
jgi:hypothetical protein